MADDGPHHDPDTDEKPIFDDPTKTEEETKKTAKEDPLSICPVSLKVEVTVKPEVPNEFHKAESVDGTFDGEEISPHL